MHKNLVGDILMHVESPTLGYFFGFNLYSLFLTCKNRANRVLHISNKPTYLTITGFCNQFEVSYIAAYETRYKDFQFERWQKSLGSTETKL